MSEEELTPEQEYQADYYRKHVDERRRYAQDQWRHNRAYQRRENERAKDRRALARADRAKGKLRKKVAAKREKRNGTWVPMLVVEDGEQVLAYSSSALGREVGRSGRVIRMWLRDGTLPGATTFLVVGRSSAGGTRRAFFSARFAMAVKRACHRLLRLNGRGEKRILKLLVLEELARDRVPYLPYARRAMRFDGFSEALKMRESA